MAYRLPPLNAVRQFEAAARHLAGISSLDVKRGPHFDTLDLAWNAAAQGMGVAIGRLPLINPELAEGRLVTVLGDPVKSRTGYWLTTTTSALSRADLVAFRSWLKAEIAELVDSEDQAPA